MSLKSFKKILKGVGKGLDGSASLVGKAADMSAEGVRFAGKSASYLAKDMTISAVGLGKTGKDIAKKVKDIAFEELSDEALENSTNILEHITGLRAKKSTNLIAFGALTAYGAFGIADDADKRRSMGNIVGADYQPNMINASMNPITEQALVKHEEGGFFGTELDMDLHDKYGSAGPDLVFALHELRNR